MTDLQLSCLVLVLFSLIVVSGYALWRVRNLQNQVDQLRSDAMRNNRAKPPCGGGYCPLCSAKAVKR